MAEALFGQLPRLSPLAFTGGLAAQFSQCEGLTHRVAFGQCDYRGRGKIG
jgi:hypothetical protein